MEKFLDWHLWYFIYLAIFEFFLISKKRVYCYEHPGLSYDKAFDFRCGKWFAFLTILPLLLIATFRELSTGDTSAYVDMFKHWPDNLSEISFSGNERFPGFIVFSVIIKQFLSSDYHLWLFIIAFISIMCVFFTYRKFTPEIVLCSFLFFASTDFASWMTNGIRQFLVVSIMFALAPLLFQKKISKYLLFVLVALLLYSFHVTALIALPVYFLALGKPFNKKTIVVLIAAFAIIVFLDQFTGVFVNVVSNTNYSNSAKEMVSDLDNGTNILRVLVYSVPGILGIIFRKRITEETPVIINYSLNMSLMTTAFYIVSMFTSGLFFGRMPIYFSLFNYILLPWEIKHFFGEVEQRFIYIIMIVMYFAFYLIQMNTWTSYIG